MFLAADAPVVALVISAGVLLACTALLSITVPPIRWRRWPWRRPATRRAARRAITGRPPELPTGPIRPAPAIRGPARQVWPGPHVQRRSDGVAEAEAAIEELFDTDPGQVAELMRQWIRQDDTRRGGA